MFHHCSSMDQCLMDLKQDENKNLAVGGFSQHLIQLIRYFFSINRKA